MELNSLYCADVPLSNYSLTHSLHFFIIHFYFWCIVFLVIGLVGLCCEPQPLVIIIIIII